MQYREVLIGIDLGVYPALVCDVCDDAYLGTKAMLEIEPRARQAGPWGSRALRFEHLSRRLQKAARRKGLSKPEVQRALDEVRRSRKPRTLALVSPPRSRPAAGLTTEVRGCNQPGTEGNQ
jgi:hypothetical protein